jgi:CRP-like cAMP-binding protein
MRALEAVLGSLSFFSKLRPDEIGRIALRFEVAPLEEGATRSFEATPEAARLVVVVAGQVELSIASAAGAVHGTMRLGDRHGEIHLLTGHARPVTLTAHEPARIATLDRRGLDAILEEFPAVALPMAVDLASELRAKNDVVRQVLELHAAGLAGDQLASAVDEQRRELVARGADVRRLGTPQLFRRLVVEAGAEPPFWILVGFIVSLGLARLVVYMILKYHLEKQLFALVPGNDPNPMHVHHFNYGLILIGAAGLAALFPFGRRGLRLLAFLFGAGAGLVFDEFALFWNLNPEYAQGMSLIAAAIAAAVLFQLVWFRAFWTALGRRMFRLVRGTR